MNRILLVFLIFTFTQSAQAADTFNFDSIEDIGSMSQYIENNFNLGDERARFRQVFIDEGKAELIRHPTKQNTEKYLYDIDLCSYYTWRWNISADFDDNGQLLQAYMNGLPVFADGPQIREINKKKEKATDSKILKVKTERPAAHKGENSLASLLFDLDGNLETTDDQELIGGGPSRPDPLNMGKMSIYQINSLWRSIFDHDKTKVLHKYDGDCSKVDVAMEKAKADHIRNTP